MAKVWSLFGDNSEMPPAKRKKADKKEYDKTKRSRGFVPSWTKEFEWVKLNEEKNVMFCTPCKNSPFGEKKGSFYVGCGNFKKETLKKHDCSESHIKCVAAELAKNAKPENTQAVGALRMLNKTNVEQLKFLFRNAHAITKHARPFTDYVWQCQLDTMKGFNISKGYLTDKYCKVFSRFISEAERIKVENEVKSVPFMSLLCDGTTDTSVTETEIVYVRYATQGKVSTKFLSIENLAAERANAETIEKSLFTSCEKQLKLSESEVLEKLVGFGSDGASVMQGIKNGVAARLKVKQPSVVAIHCFAHRLELAFKDMLKKVPYHSKFLEVIEGLYVFFHYSTLNRSNLTRTADSMNVKCLAPSRAGGTRWMPHTQKALERIWKMHGVFILLFGQMQQDSQTSSKMKNKALFFLKNLRTKQFVTYGHHLTDIISILSTMSLTFQATECSASEIHESVQSAVSVLTKLKARPGPKLQEVLHVDSFQGEMLTGEITTEKQRMLVVDSLLESLQNRFADAKIGVLNALQLLSFKLWPEHDESGGFGEDHIKTLVSHFHSHLTSHTSIDEIQTEWMLLKDMVYTRYLTNDRRPKLSWVLLNRHHGEKFPNILTLVDLLLSIPAHSADCERGFSHMKKVKTDWRSCLTPDSVTDLMRITLLSPSVEEFDPEPAMDLWFVGGERSRRVHANEEETGSNESSSDSE